MGSLFRPKYAPEGQSFKEARETGTLRESAVFWMKYRANGKIIREGAGTDNRLEASRLLKRKEGAVAEGRHVAPRADKVTVKDLADGLVLDYKANERKSLDRLQLSIKHLLPFLGDRKAVDLSTTDIRAYIARRQNEKAANGTINRELSALKRAFGLALKDERLHRRPHFPMLRESAARSGFFEREQFEAVLRHLPDYVRPVAVFQFQTGWRTYKEVLPLTWKAIDFKAGVVRLEPGTTKNDDGRSFYLTPELRAVLESQRAATVAMQREHGTIIPWVFHRNGEQLRDFRKSWRTACRLAGCPGRIPHDFRRTAVRNLERAGVSRSVAMKMTGHKTESVYRRYAIVSDGDLREASAKLARVEG